MENIENTLEDAKLIITDIRRGAAVDVVYSDNSESIHYLTASDKYPIRYSLHGGACIRHHDGDDASHVWTVSPVSPLLAGMVLAAIKPHDERIERGVDLSNFAGQLEDIFPQACVDWSYQTLNPCHYEMRVMISPLQDSYYKRVSVLFPVWSWGNWYVFGDGYYFLSRDTPPIDFGAYQWLRKGAPG